MILVTGAAGFVGAHLTKRLSDEGATVRAVYHRRGPTPDMEGWPGVTWQRADLLDIYDAAAVMAGISDIYHCAAIISFEPERKAEMIHSNTEISANVVNAALDAGARRMLHISSVAALGRDGTAKEITEDAQWEESGLNSGYGLSKYGAEMEVWRGVGEGLEGVILNPGIILGAPLHPDSWREGSPKLLQTAYNEFRFFTDGITAFVDVADVAAAAIGLMRSEISGERYILSAGNFPFQEIFNRMADALGRRRPRYHAGPVITGLVWRWSFLKGLIEGTKSIITRETARNAQLKTFYRGDKILRDLPGFRYTPIGETITEMSEAFLDQRVA